MTGYRDGWQPSERRLWVSAFVPLVVVMGVWAFSTPLFTGPDEVSQARRAAAVVRGQFTGRAEREGPPLLLAVEVPPLYGDPAEQNWLCHLGPLVDGAPQEAMRLPSPPCPDLDEATVRSEGRESVVAETVQYRGQPFFYGLVGLPTLVSEGVAGAYWMRLVGGVITAALLASAIRTVAGSRRRPLAALGLLAGVTPGLAYLGGTTNPSAVEIAAALSAWAAVAMLASTDPSQAFDPLTGRLVRRLGMALVVLTLGRGLGPAFAAAVVVVGALAAGLPRTRLLLARRDLRAWGAVIATSVLVSGAWLAHIAREYPLPERAGSGFIDALGWLPWYLHQSVGVFGTNDSAVAPLAAAIWCVLALAIVAVGVVLIVRDGSTLRHGHAARGRMALLGVVTLVAGLMMNVTAEGLSLPPIGFFWQGRYALPLALGGIVLVTTSRPSGAEVWTGSATARLAASAIGAVLVVVHVHAFWTVTGHLDVDEARMAGSTFYAIALLMVVESTTGYRLTHTSGSRERYDSNEASHDSPDDDR